MQQQPKSTNPSPNPSDTAFLQDSSLMTAPQQPLGGGDILPVSLPSDQKNLSPARLGLAQLDSQGSIRIDLSVSASALILGRLLGKGGFGVVYEGVYQGKPVAIKQLSGHLSADALAELKREAEIMFQLGLSSEHVVKLIKICLETPYSLVMELMPQGSLYDVLRNGQDLPWQTRYQIAADSAQGLSDLHERKILHRDLKSLNILLRNGRAKLADFGLAKVKHETGSQSSVTAKGTVLWMAPELFDDEPKMTTASDIYSFGMVLWELVTRQLPYAKASNPMVAARWIEKGKKEEIPGDCPPAFKKIIESCWQSTPTERPTAIRVLADLKPLVEQKVSPLNDSNSEIKKLKAQMEQMKLAQEQQLRAAAEEKRRLEAEKQADIERIKQQYQAELTELKCTPKELKYETAPVQPPKSTLLLPSVSQTIWQTWIPLPKSQATPEQLPLQDRLIAACKQGDEKAVGALLQQGAQSSIANVKGEQPLGAAIWGMCPDVVHALLKQAGGVASMTWRECEHHNLKYYKEVFIVSKFAPQTYREWYQLLVKIDLNPFIRTFHLKKADKEWHDADTVSWEELKKQVKIKQEKEEEERYEKIKYVESYNRIYNTHVKIDDMKTWTYRYQDSEMVRSTDKEFISFRAQIKQWIESAKQPTKLAQEDLKYESPVQLPKPTPPLSPVSQIIPQTIMAPPKPKASPAQLALQDQLIAACKQGDEKAVKALLQQGAKPDIANAKGEQPLGAAVWGMCPGVVSALLTHAGGVAPMTWQECEQHNKKYYNNEVFIIPKFDPQTFGEWNTLLQKMDPNPFIRAYHLMKVDELWHDNDSSSWYQLRMYVREGASITDFDTLRRTNRWRKDTGRRDTAVGFISYRSQIKQGIESAKQPTVALHF